jgi:hypothetical protein
MDVLMYTASLARYLDSMNSTIFGRHYFIKSTPGALQLLLCTERARNAWDC